GGLYDEAASSGPPKMPPALLVHGGADTEVAPQKADAFCSSLKAAGRACTLITVDQAIHRPENWWPTQWSYKAQLTSWLATAMRLPAPDHQPYSTSLTKGIVYDAERRLAMDEHTPPGAGPFPAVLIAHGG